MVRWRSNSAVFRPSASRLRPDTIQSWDGFARTRTLEMFARIRPDSVKVEPMSAKLGVRARSHFGLIRARLVRLRPTLVCPKLVKVGPLSTKPGVDPVEVGQIWCDFGRLLAVFVRSWGGFDRFGQTWPEFDRRLLEVGQPLPDVDPLSGSLPHKGVRGPCEVRRRGGASHCQHKELRIDRRHPRGQLNV